MGHPLDTDPRVVAANALLGQIRTANRSHEWRALQQILDAHPDARELVSCLAFAMDARAREALKSELDESIRSYRHSLEVVK